jgi:LysR family glycine cleavage system transcriptional activator
MSNVDFQRDDADLAIRYGYGEWTGVTAEHLLDDAFIPVCSPRLIADRPLRRPEDLARFALLRAADEPWKPWFEAAGLDWPEPSRGPIFNDSAHMLQAAAEGQGVALARRSLLGNDVRNGILVRLFDVDAPSPRKFWLVYPPRMSGTAKLALFRRWLRDEIESDHLQAESAPRETGRSRSPRVAGARRRRMRT